MGLDSLGMARHIFGDAAREPDFPTSKTLGTDDAMRELANVWLIEESSSHYYKSTREGEQHSVDKTQWWAALCAPELKPEQAALLQVVNDLSEHAAEDHAWVEMIDQDAIVPAMGWPDGIEVLMAVSLELEDARLVRAIRAAGPNVRLQATYRGLVWERRRGFTLESRAIDELLTEWETTSVDFKRELRTDTADQKAELIKDVNSLVNTQASGQRWLIIGFHDETREYYGSPDPKLTQEHLEQLMSEYTDPVVDIRYQVVDYRQGKVGRLEVVRDAKKLPYGVAKSIGDKKRVEKGDIFVRHGSLSERPTESELLAIEEEGIRARGSGD